MNKDSLIKRLKDCIQLGVEYKSIRYVDHGDTAKMKSLYGQWYPQTVASLQNIFGNEHPYTTTFRRTCSSPNFPSIDEGIGILNGAVDDIEKGYLNSLFGLISAEIFSDFLEMGNHLLENNYKDAAAVMIGSVLEEHLRQLCSRYLIELTVLKGTDEVPKKANLLNADLAKAGAYNLIQQKIITGWLGLRNSAAHGKYTEYTIDQIKLMYQGVLDFIGRTT